MNTTLATARSVTANVRLQALNSLFSPASDFNRIFASALSSPFQDSDSTAFDLLASFMQGSSAKQSVMCAGRNMSLFDPESAYRMMTTINNREVLYKAQLSELRQMKTSVARMQDAGQCLGSLAASDASDRIRSRVQDFVAQYNDWVQRFEPDMQRGGLLANTQAAQVSRFELEQSVRNIFNGALDGFHGLGDLGISVDTDTRLIALDLDRLDAALAGNKQGAVNALREFSANFAQSANLLNADNNFIPRQLDNLDRAIHYIGDNMAALREEFGTGDAARPAGQVARALAEYNQNGCI